MEVKSIKNAVMAEYCTFRTGGPADILYIPESEDQLVYVLKKLRDSGTPYIITGKGSNILFSDDGYRGAVIRLGDDMSNIRMNSDGSIYVQCGLSLHALVSFCIKNSKTGLEFASGIPGTVGGGLAMNAGAYGGELKNCLKSCRLLDRNLNITEISADEMDMSYRHSRLSDSDEILLSAVFEPAPGDSTQSLETVRELNRRRAEKQPLNYASAGSTFKRPEGFYAGTLIQECGLKGKSIGGAQVSEKHAGFIINTGNATSRDIFKLIKYVQRTVYEMKGVMLEPEVKMIGEFK